MSPQRILQLWLCLLVAASSPGCSDGTSGPSVASGKAKTGDRRAAARIERVERSLRRAMEWMATIDVHPLRLRAEHGMKGIKHMVEYLDFHYLAYRWSSDPAVRSVARERALELLEVTDAPAYHDLASVDDERFRQDSMSYLRACWLAECFGKDTTLYRAEIDKVLGRIHAHLPSRGVDQRMGFALLFEQLGLPPVESREDIYPDSLIARRVPMSYYQRAAHVPYDITHEIFSMTARGRRAFPFPDREAERYARETVRKLLARSMAEDKLDLAGEFLVNLAELGEGQSGLAATAAEYILRAQNEDGSFGRYEMEARIMRQRNPRYDVRIGGNLHTTMVCVWALVDVCLKGSS